MGKAVNRKSVTRKAGTALALACALAAAGTATALAVGPESSEDAGPSVTSLGVSSINVAPSSDAVGGEVMHIVKKGIDLYSVDAGQTWNDTIPAGFVLGSDGNLEKIK